jgi:hypothetical protein
MRHKIVLLGKIPGSKKSYIFIRTKNYTYVRRLFAARIYSNFSFCVKSFPITPVRCNFIHTLTAYCRDQGHFPVNNFPIEI